MITEDVKDIDMAIKIMTNELVKKHKLKRTIKALSKELEFIDDASRSIQERLEYDDIRGLKKDLSILKDHVRRARKDLKEVL